jgi:outer membrane protein assembly factor BamB
MLPTSFSAPRRAILSIALLGAIAMPAGGRASATDWLVWRGPAQNGVTPEAVAAWPAAGPRRLWSATIGKSYAAVSVGGRRLYTIGALNGEETVYCLDAVSGRPVWKRSWKHPERVNPYEPDHTASTGTPVVAGDRVYVLTREGLALCLNAKDGSPCWQRDLAQETQNGLPPFGCGSSPVLYRDRVIYNVGKHGVALNRQTGAVVWNSGSGVAGHASAVVYRMDGRDGLCLLAGDALMGVDPENGNELWRYPWPSANHIYAIDPIVSGDRIFVASYARSGQVRLAGQSVASVYDTRTLRATFSNPVLVDLCVYGCDRGALQCVDWSTGVEKWSQPGVLHATPAAPAEGAPRYPMSEGALIAAGKQLIVLDDSGTLHLVSASPDAYHEIAHASVLKGPCWTMPVLANGLLYCRNNAGDLVCLDLRPPRRARGRRRR